MGLVNLYYNDMVGLKLTLNKFMAQNILNTNKNEKINTNSEKSDIISESVKYFKLKYHIFTKNYNEIVLLIKKEIKQNSLNLAMTKMLSSIKY